MALVSQTTDYSTSLNVWQALQELGNNLSGSPVSFTFRVDTSVLNSSQFDFTAENSRIFDKTTNTSIGGCVPSGSDPSDRLRGLTFSTAGVPGGYEDVTIDFSCRSYTFTPGHYYLISIVNANMAAFGGMRIHFRVGLSSGTDYFSGGGLRYSFDNSFCNASNYIYNSSTVSSNCNIFGNVRDDLYFTLNDNSPAIDYPVIFIPGIGGSELKAVQDIIWSADNGHGGTYALHHEFAIQGYGIEREATMASIVTLPDYRIMTPFTSVIIEAVVARDSKLR